MTRTTRPAPAATSVSVAGEPASVPVGSPDTCREFATLADELRPRA